MRRAIRPRWAGFAGAAALAGVALLGLSQTVVSGQQPKPATGPQVTFTKDVAPIFQKACQDCHRPGSIAPMSLVSYEDARPWARSIKAKVSNREMPPWYIERTVGIQKFKGDPSLSDAELNTIVKWVDGGAVKGNPADMPPPKQFAVLDSASWEIGTPDMVLELPKEVTIPAVGPDWWVDFTVDTKLTEDRYIQAVQTKPGPGAHRVVHHAAASMIFPGDDDDDRGGFLNEYAVGKNADVFPEEAGRLIKAGTKVRVNMHYHSIGEEIKDRTRIGLKFFPKGYKPKYRVVTQHVGDSFDDIDIRAGDDNARSDGYFVLPEPAIVQSFQPHLHNRGKRQCVEAVYPTGKIETLSCAKHNFAWMLTYIYADEVAPILPAGTILHVISWHDNSTNNRYNPDPRNWTGFGNRSVDDMAFAWMSFHYLSQDEYKQKLKERGLPLPKTTTNNQF